MPGQRKPGMDHDFYQWSPITARPPLKWPHDARVAVTVLVHVDWFDWENETYPQPVTPLGGPPITGEGGNRYPDIAGFGQRNYGNRVGLWRIMDLIDKHGFKATVPMDKAIAENFPYIVKELMRRKVEFVGHGTTARRLIHIGMSEEQERQYIRESLDAVEKATGKRPVGWASPQWQETPNTPNLLAAEGVRYVCDWANDEQPYAMTPKQGELYSLPVDLTLDDEYCHVHGKRLVGEYSQIIQDSFDQLYLDGAKTGRSMVISVHPWVMGFPWRIKYLDMALAHIAPYGNVWKATGSEIVDWYKAHSK